ncbi:universal stress protein [Pseudoruegeria sp. SHC-113]|uniref:universal stress protein n=1 Tax=Pseudoruegeria sp. SHC-113 TaxID=2855439 RepID=UPI0021BAB8EB|nr:universal stress protein [Pseudoruegeria sp. SHC-113]MCT8160686.1 universal stress protein [Pseudoruegeria sp. SHC-113]
MAIMNLLVSYNGSPASDAALRYAAELAKGRGAQVTALLAHSTHEVIDSSSRWIPAQARALLTQANADIVAGIAAQFEALAQELALGDALRFREQAGRVDVTLAEAARCYDMIIVGRHMDADDAHVALHPDRIALLSGRPVIVVPEGYRADADHSHAALAWDGSRSAARALSDSLRLLEAEGKVSVISFGTPVGGIADLLQHLRLHGVSPVHEDFPESHAVAETLLAYCDRHDPSLLVMGAYEHSKFREDFLGGDTAKVLRDIRIPVLLSH